MITFRSIVIALLVLVVANQLAMMTQKRHEGRGQRAPGPRLTRLLEQAQLNENRLTAMAAQNEVLTTRTLAILERLSALPMSSSLHGPDAPVVLYEAEPVKTAGRKGARQ